MKNSFSLTVQDRGDDHVNVDYNVDGDFQSIAEMLATAMYNSADLTALVVSAIPYLLHEQGRIDDDELRDLTDNIEDMMLETIELYISRRQ